MKLLQQYCSILPTLLIAIIFASIFTGCNHRADRQLDYIEVVLHASRLSTQLSDTLFMAKSEELLGDIYEATYNIELALEQRRKSASLYKAANKRTNTLYTYLDQCRELDYLSKSDEEIALCDTILSLVWPTDSIIMAEVYSNKAIAYSRLNQSDKTREASNKAQYYYGDNFLDYADVLFVADCYKRINEPDSVRKYLELSKLSSDYYDNDILRYSNLKWLAVQDKDYEKAYLYADSASMSTNKMFRTIMERQGVFARADYYLWQLDNENSQSHAKTILIIIMVLAMAVVSYGISKYYRSRHKKLQQQIDSRLTEISQLRDDITHLHHVNKALTTANSANNDNSLLQDILKTGFATFDAVTKSHYTTKKTTRAEDINLTRHLEAEITQLRNKKFLESIVNYVDSTHSSVIGNLSQQVPSIKLLDLQLIALRIAGFSVQSICVLLDISSSNYYTRWHRLRERVTESSAADKELFFKYLS